MKKLLLASTALALSAGVATADIKLSGEANVGVKYNSENLNDVNDPNNSKDKSLTLHNEVDFFITASGETDGGLTFGASIDIEQQSDDGMQKTADDTRDPEVYVSAGGLTVTVGNIAEASDISTLSDVGYDGVGADDIFDNITERGVHDFRIEYAIDSWTFALSGGSSNETFAASVQGEFSGFDWGVAYADLKNNEGDGGDLSGVNFATVFGADDSDPSPVKNVKEVDSDDLVTIKLGYDFGDFDVDFVGFNNEIDDASVTGAGFDVTFTAGDFEIIGVISSVQYKDFAALDDNTIGTIGIGASYDLGGGASVAGGIAQLSSKEEIQVGSDKIDSLTKADLGLVFKF